jgi:hypothetical protein
MVIYRCRLVAGIDDIKCLFCSAMKGSMTILPPEELEKKRALEFLALSPTEKFYAAMRLITMANLVWEAGKAKRENQNFK